MPAAQTAPARKTLEYQLGRLDSILDGLADGLNEAVTMAVQNAVAETVREAIRHTLQEELATSRYLPMNRLNVLLEQEASSATQGRIQELLGQLRNRATLTVLSAHRFIAWMWTWRWQVLLAAGVGLGVGGSSFLISPLLGVILLGMLASGITLACLRASAGRPSRSASVATSGDRLP